MPTAWALLTKTERFRVHLVSNLAEEEVLWMRMIPARSLEDALTKVPPDAKGYIMPRGRRCCRCMNVRQTSHFERRSIGRAASPFSRC